MRGAKCAKENVFWESYSATHKLPQRQRSLRRQIYHTIDLRLMTTAQICCRLVRYRQKLLQSYVYDLHVLVTSQL